MSLSESDKELVVPVDSFFRELLLTYRVLFGQDERSFRAFQRSCSGQNAHQSSDTMLPVLCEKSWTTPEARDLYRDISAGAVRDTYDSSADFPIMGQKLLALQQFVKDYHPRTLTALLRDRRDPTAWFNFWTTQVQTSDYRDLVSRMLTDCIGTLVICVPGYPSRCITISVSNLASRTCKATARAELSHHLFTLRWLAFKP
jgi:hypothetical protein